ncbi:hypothetical protein SERLADRAFT_479081 [Serpula lacrymans var. lacrymans S7.9]|uniref:Uncharacterized protein n=1 Tax=Serpula lacrymans var. lacrymans (strain S7.9) TaxID=578457 RepID=F8PB98_SERL9|nr:uncharacterized protein SERLADRAFT_479081 [Serpula lacrymans var. lacrymans S7.9]EGO19538.1 hypothetical protein SERLADRAFT_479081 [Serpula lacrymans var. lacrymans S7.9]
MSVEKHANPTEENAVSSKTCHGTSQRCCTGGRRPVIDEVCGQMVLAVSERVWLRETQDS